MPGRRYDARFNWVHRHNTARLMHRLGRRPPAEAEAAYYADRQAAQPT